MKVPESTYSTKGEPYSHPDEEIIGIPQKGLTHPIRAIAKPEAWEFVVHDHHALKAGRHYDLRLGDPETGHGHSWALRKWPAPGEKRLAIIQSTHSIPYFDWKGTIESGYGAGKVEIADRRKVTVTKTTPDQITFASGPHEVYSLVRTGLRDSKAWLLVNRSQKKE